MWSLGLLADIFTTVQLVDLSWLPWLTVHVLVFSFLTVCAKKQKKTSKVAHKTNSFMALPQIPNATALSVIKDPSKEPSKQQEVQNEEAKKEKEKEKEGHDDREERKELKEALKQGGTKDSKKETGFERLGEQEEQEERGLRKSEKGKDKLEEAKTQPDDSNEKVEVKKTEETQLTTGKTQTASKSKVDKTKQSKEKKSGDDKEDKEEGKEKSEEKKEEKKEEEKKEVKKQDDFEINMPDIRWEAEEGQATFKVTNHSGKRVAYKIKTSDANIYSVLPVYGFLDDKESKDVTVVRQKAPIKDDTLAIMFCEATPEETGSAEIFKKPGAKPQHKMLPMLKK